MAQIWKMRTPDGNVVTPGDWTGAEPLFSVVEVAQGNIPRLTAFSYGKEASAVPGSIGPRRATAADTNLEGEGGRLPENEELICYNIAIEVMMIGGPGSFVELPNLPLPDPPLVAFQNLLRLQRDMVVSFRIAAVDKTYIRAPLSYFPASVGPYQWNTGARTEFGVTPFVSATNGSPNADDIRILASPLRVRGGETFGVDFTPGPGQIEGLNLDEIIDDELINAGRLRLRTYLDGYRRRPVA
jgi:hypothetical protein